MKKKKHVKDWLEIEENRRQIGVWNDYEIQEQMREKGRSTKIIERGEVGKLKLIMYEDKKWRIKQQFD